MFEGDLARLQRRFWRLVTAPEGVARGLSDLAREDPDSLPLSGWVAASNEAAAIDRVDVYANMYFYRLLDVLREDHPKLSALIGEARFHNLVTDYLLAHPSRSATVRDLGAQLGAFIEHHPYGVERPELADLACLERARIEAFDAADPTPLTRADLGRLASDQWADLRLAPHPTLQILDVRFPVHELWLALARGETAPTLGAAPATLLVWRRGFEVLQRPALAPEAEALGWIRRGDCFGTLCERVAERQSDAGAAEAVLALLLRWIDDRLVVCAANSAPQSSPA